MRPRSGYKMEIDSRRISRLIRQSRTRERRLDQLIRSQAWLDGVAVAVQKAVGASYEALGAPGQAIKNVMHGTRFLGHPLHPVLTDIPVGAWTVGVLADWLFVATGRLPAVAGDLALAIGVAGAILAALTGYTDFHETDGHERRTAIVHGLTMTAVLLIELVSLGMRLGAPGLRPGAIVLSTVAWLIVLVGAYVGGHLTFGIGSAVNHNAFFDGPKEYVKVGTRDDFPEGQMRRVEANGLPVLIVRQGGLLHAMGAVCAHAGGSTSLCSACVSGAGSWRSGWRIRSSSS
ncbi:MAG: Rieske 2Fe-2S domain-containing protein [Chloroflexi bacterium]|nr:MAG: Rieske 2Fe-2S domain-containing protein [Chloroflexota bacterium]